MTDEMNKAPTGGAAGGVDEPTPGQGMDGNDPGEDTKKLETFEDVLKSNSAFQSELDRRIRQAVEKATAKERERQQTIRDAREDEILRVSQMTQEEKDAYFKQKAAKEQAEREANLTKRELTLDAREALQERHLPEAFLSLLDYTDKEAMLKSVDTLEASFKAAVQSGVTEQLKGGPAPKDAGTEGDKPKPLDAQQKALEEAMRVAGLK